MVKKSIKKSRDSLKTLAVKAAGYVSPVAKSPDEVLGELFMDVQQRRMFSDSKIFADLIPRRKMQLIRQEYLLERKDPMFDLQEFINRHFYTLQTNYSVIQNDPGISMRDHVRSLWRGLERYNRKNRGSLIALPHKYVVPGGRFNEQFYWDSYFIMLGLAADSRWDVIEGMVKNYNHMIRKFGYIPTANRTYFLSRSQPPFYSRMIELLQQHQGKYILIKYLPYLLAEYNFWMKGISKVRGTKYDALRRVVQLPDGSLVNRYYDDKSTPRPESLHEDISTANSNSENDPERVFLHLRAAAESGWDFSSRWFVDPNDLKTIITADIVPVDLNVLLHHLEMSIAKGYAMLKNALMVRHYKRLADKRHQAIMKYCWDESEGCFVDYNFRTGRSTGIKTLAMVFPLYGKIATQEQASKIAEIIEKEFLQSGGLLTTLEDTGQQWDKPNGWAPLQYIAIEGLRNYGFDDLANEIKQRWLNKNKEVFLTKGKMVEKYNVEGGDGLGGGGEYPLQDGFGWTNGVVAVLLDEPSREPDQKNSR